MCLCTKLLCFFGFHKWEVRRATQEQRVTKKRSVYHEIKQCERCCKIKRTGVVFIASEVIKSTTSKTDIKNCKL